MLDALKSLLLGMVIVGAVIATGTGLVMLFGSESAMIIPVTIAVLMLSFWVGDAIRGNDG